MKIINTIHNQDCILGMKNIPNEKMDLIVTDPPFAINFNSKKSNYNRRPELVLDGYNEISRDNYLDFSIDWITEAKRILKESGSMYIFSGWNNLKDILIAIDDVKLEVIGHPIWKYQFGVYSTKRFVSSHYHILYVCKDKSKRKFYSNSRFTNSRERYQDLQDVWEIKREYWTGKIKPPTKLPSELITKILQYSSKPKDLVFDPFLGSGQVAVVSKKLHRKYCGFEIVKQYFKFANERLNHRCK